MKRIPLLLVGLLSFVSSGFAASYTWDGSTDDDWGVGANWSSNIVPTSADTAIFVNGAPNLAIDLGGSSYSANQLTFTGTGYTISNGTLTLSSANAITGAGVGTINADMVLTPGTKILSSSVLNGDISGVGAAIQANGPLLISGNNTFTGGTINRNQTVRAGSDTAFGTGTMQWGIGLAETNTLSAIGSTARTFDNAVSWRNTGVSLGDSTGVNNGALTFNSAITMNFTGTNTTGLINIYTNVDLVSGLQLGVGATDLVLTITSGTNSKAAAPMLTLGAASSRTAQTLIGGGLAANVRVTADNALGSGLITLAAQRGTLYLEGDISLTNAVEVSGAESTTFLVSSSGSNTISGNVRVNGNNAGFSSQIEVTQDSLTLSGGIRGASGTAINSLSKSGAGTLVLTGTTEASVVGLYINNGALRAVEGTGVTSAQLMRFTGTGTSAGVFESNGTFSRTLGASANQVQWQASSNGGFAAHGGVFNIQIGNGTNTLSWGSTSNFVGTGGNLVLNSLTANNLVDFQNGIDLNNGTRTIQVLDNAASTADQARISGVISGTGAGSNLVKTGAGLLELTAINTYAGTTTVNAGTLVIAAGGGIGNGAVNVNAGELQVNGSTGTGVFTVANGASLSGTGTVGGAAVINGTHNPGNSPGTQTFTDGLTYGATATVNWELSDNTAAGPGTNFDVINVTAGGLSITSDAEINLVFNAVGSAVDWSEAFWDADQSWTFYNVTGGIVGTFVLDSVSFDSLGQSLASVRPGAGFSIEYTTDSVNILYTAVPEPSTWAFLGLGLGLVFLRTRKGVRN